MSPERGSSGDHKARQMLWIIPSTLLVLLIGYSLYSGQTIEEIGLGGLGTVKFAKPGGAASPPPAPSSPNAEPPTDTLVRPEAAKQVDQDEMVRRQVELESKLHRMEEALKHSEARPVRGASQADASMDVEAARIPRQVDIGGTWRDKSGVSWMIQQTGQAVTFEEYNPILGVTAVGQGTVSGRQLQLTYQSALETNGEAVLTLSSDGKNLTGNARDHVTGLSFPLVFHR